MSSLERKGDTVFTTPNIDADDQESANRSRVSTSDDSLTIGSRVRNSIDIARIRDPIQSGRILYDEIRGSVEPAGGIKLEILLRSVNREPPFFGWDTATPIILDTPVISDFMAPDPDPKVARWISNRVDSEFFITSITVAELRYGIDLLPPGNPRNVSETIVNQTIAQFREDRILPFDRKAANAYSQIRVSHARSGLTYCIEECMIAGIAKSLGIPVATREGWDLEAAGVELINPWEYSP